ncbi:hypothetical protein FFLO_01568 [Filobasidium floriforme]|uniref:Uncharacterized protein n=1 Tax=Filobasidium floriforme TaxID=5210 RepID=A0A8K0JPD5_9TREE|nr:uncharacterized protein HD553DRAFT_363129 [Filobasidium floriforme]KAG7563010.1 hypothetical protein FFLO_01568 [Filobasidium floriforme]KAH8079255.1 hypothetical protein HD553DRAFT_363129 [Filobasidium floriforme]
MGKTGNTIDVVASSTIKKKKTSGSAVPNMKAPVRPAEPKALLIKKVAEPKALLIKKVAEPKALRPWIFAASGGYNDEEAYMLYLALKKDSPCTTVDDYLKSVDLKLNGQPLARNLSCWYEVGWGTCQWHVLRRGFELGTTTSIQPHATKLVSFKASDQYQSDSKILKQYIMWYSEHSTAVKEELRAIAVAHAHATGNFAGGVTGADAKQTVFRETVKAIDAFNGGRTRAIEMSMRCLRTESSASYAVTRSDFESIKVWASEQQADLIARKGVQVAGGAGSQEFFNTLL